MKYEAPEMEILYLEAEDVITVSNNGTAGDGIDTRPGETTKADTGW